jgi:hypothetical protein
MRSISQQASDPHATQKRPSDPHLTTEHDCGLSLGLHGCDRLPVQASFVDRSRDEPPDDGAAGGHVTLLSAWALAGLALLVPLVIAHLRRVHRQIYDVPSLLLWDALDQPGTPRSRRARLRLPLLLVLQALALVLLVVSLARLSGSASPPTATRVFVLDDSLWMGAGSRLEAAEAQIERLAGRLPLAPPCW